MSRRDLNSFAPFRADEIIESSFRNRDTGAPDYEYYPTFAGRLRVAREVFPNLSIKTSVHSATLREHAIVKAETVGVTTAGIKAEGSGIGTADKTGDARLSDSLIELAETRAISRALRSMGIGAEMVSAEEMARADIVQQMLQPLRPNGLPPSPNAQPPATPPPMTPAQTVATPPPAAHQQVNGRRALGDLIYSHAGQSKERAAQILAAILPGKTSPAQLSDHEVEIAKLVVEAAVVCDTVTAVFATKASLQQAIKATLPVEQWTPAHVVAAWEAIRNRQHPQPGHSAAAADGCPF